MNNSRVDRLIPEAYEVLKMESVGIAINNKIESGFHGQISSFCSSIANGSLISAIAFFSDNGKAKVERAKLLIAIFKLLPEELTSGKSSLFEVEKSTNGFFARQALEDKVLECATALNLAMNLYEFFDPKQKKEVKGK